MFSFGDLSRFISSDESDNYFAVFLKDTVVSDLHNRDWMISENSPYHLSFTRITES